MASDSSKELKFAGFWKRFFASIFDMMIIGIPFFILSRQVHTWSPNSQLFYKISTYVFWMCLNIYLLIKFGGTPGKLAVGVRVVKFSGEKIDFKCAFLRNLVDNLYSMIHIAFYLYMFNEFDFELIKDASMKIRANYWRTVYPDLYYRLGHLYSLYEISEAFVMLTNKKRRAIHDFIGGTVVVHRYRNFEELKEDMYERLPKSDVVLEDMLETEE